MKSPIQLFVAIAVLLATATVTAQVYKWVDKDGKVQYSDTPPPADAKASPKKVELKSAAAPAGAPPPASGKDAGKDAAKSAPGKPLTLEERNKEYDKRRAEQLDAAKKAAEQARLDKTNEERCKGATRYLRDLETGRPINTTDDSGDRKLLDDNARASEMTKARAAMTESCK
jgi:hypothetical protein